jgi:hypothetical protein
LLSLEVEVEPTSLVPFTLQVAVALVVFLQQLGIQSLLVQQLP